jgi:ferredoxin
MSTLKIWVDRAKCTGSGLCIEECPSLFTADAKGKGMIKTPAGPVTGVENRVEVAPADHAAARTAYDLCPTSAIHIATE